MGKQPGLLASGFCQMAYVTNDLDAAMALFRDHHEVAHFLELRDFAVQTGPDRHALLNIALAYAGGVQIEIMQPLGDDDGTYRQILHGKGGFELHYHHECQRAYDRDALDHLKSSAEARGFPIVIEGGTGDGVRYFYADCRSTIGHHVEYIWYSDEAFEQICGAIPIN